MPLNAQKIYSNWSETQQKLKILATKKESKTKIEENREKNRNRKKLHSTGQKLVAFFCWFNTLSLVVVIVFSSLEKFIKIHTKYSLTPMPNKFKCNEMHKFQIKARVHTVELHTRFSANRNVFICSHTKSTIK